MRKIFSLSALMLFSVTIYSTTIHSTSVYAETWNSDWGPVIVEADGNTFVGRYNMPVGGIVVMDHQGGGNYSGYWARSCTSTKRYQIPAPVYTCLLYTSPSPRDRTRSRMPSSA